MTDLRLATGSAEPSGDSGRVRAVKRRLASAMLPPLPPVALGDVRLLPHQRQAAAQLLRVLQRHGGALLADDVGLGKTFTALAVAQHYAHTHVLAPAGLVAMWQAALLRAAQPRTRIHSLHRASRQPLAPLAEPIGDAGAKSDRTLVIIDEAHALRNAATMRYRHVARAVSGCDVLLLSATPLHNSPRDLAVLLALFRGPHGDSVPDHLLATLVIRRQQQHISDGNGTDRRRASSPAVRVHQPLTVPQQRETLDRLLALPAPLPARDGAVAGALIRLGLLRAWCSSDAALTQALTKRLQRGTAMRDALEAGRHPSNAELGAWLIDEDAFGDMQLGFAELLSSHVLQPDAQHTALDLLGKHCDALRMLREFHVAHARADNVRVGYLRAICARHAGTPVVAFSQHGRTVQALFRALSDIAGVGMLTGSQARVASGKVTRPELLGWFAPRAQGRPPPPPSLRLNLLLTTDLIAEGVNLQDAGVVVHLDLPWTHALRAQRTGRVVRIGSTHEVAHEYRLRASRAVRRVLRAEQTVARKAALAARLVGDRQAHAVGACRSAVHHAARWDLRLLHWALETDVNPEDATSAPRWARLVAAHGVTGAIVLVRTAEGARLLACVLNGTRWWLSVRAEALLAVSAGEFPTRGFHRLRQPVDTAPPLTTATQRALGQAVRLWVRRQRALQISGATVAGGAVDHDVRNQTQRRAMEWLQRRVANLSAVERAQRARYVQEAQSMIASAASAGAAVALRQWMDDAEASARGAWPDWRVFPELSARSPMTVPLPAREARTGALGCIEACLWVWPA